MSTSEPNPAQLQMAALVRQGELLAQQAVDDLRDGGVPVSDRRVILSGMIAHLVALDAALGAAEPA